jgi:hypothetical protein
MNINDIVQIADISVSVGCLMWIIYRMEKGHAAAIARLWNHIEQHDDLPRAQDDIE